MTATRENAQLFEGRVTFYFSGWDDDPRETAAIHEIRAWLSKLTEKFPYWLHFLEKQDDSSLDAKTINTSLLIQFLRYFLSIGWNWQVRALFDIINIRGNPFIPFLFAHVARQFFTKFIAPAFECEWLSKTAYIWRNS